MDKEKSKTNEYLYFNSASKNNLHRKIVNELINMNKIIL